jgi:aspartate racemase
VPNEPVIGIVGGVGPYAALDLARKIFDETAASRDQDHLPVALLSYPRLIPDRTAFLLGETDVNPALGILAVIADLERLGCQVIGIPCHTAHAPAIWDVIVEGLAERGSGVRLLHIVEEVAAFIRQMWPGVTSVGVLSTIGAQRSGTYPSVFARHGLKALTLEDSEHGELVHASVYDPDFGIKAHASPVAERARRNVLVAVERLRATGAEVVVLGCTELPLAVPEAIVGKTPVIDATRVLARALVRSVAPGFLKS